MKDLSRLALEEKVGQLFFLGFHGIEPAPAGIGHNFERWFVPEPLQKYTMTAAP